MKLSSIRQFLEWYLVLFIDGKYFNLSSAIILKNKDLPVFQFCSSLKARAKLKITKRNLPSYFVWLVVNSFR